MCPALAYAKPLGSVEISDARLRLPLPRHPSTLGFMTLRSSEDMRLVGVKTAAAKAVSFQRMTREDSELRVEPADAIDLPAGRFVALAIGPGHHHLLLKSINTELRVGSMVRMVATVRRVRDGIKQLVRFKARVESPRGYRASEDNDADH